MHMSNIDLLNQVTDPNIADRKTVHIAQVIIDIESNKKLNKSKVTITGNIKIF